VHELSVAQALVEQVEGLMAEHGAQGVARIRLRIGPLSGVLPDLLATALPLAAAGTGVEGAELECVASPLRVRCQTCGAESDAQPNRLLCASCGDWHTQVISGDEMILERVELDIPETADTPLPTANC
jgi:hydrogenase nickel incorporation protein HypA/HybF